MKTKFISRWILWTLLGALLMYGVSSSDSKNSILTIVAMVLSFSPLLGLMLALGSPKASGEFYDWLKDNNKLGGQHKVPRLSNSRDYLDDLLKLNS